MKNRWLAIIIAVAALLSLISGCGNSGSSAASAASADSAVPASEPEESAGQPETTEPDLENSEAPEASVEPEPQEAGNTIEYPISDEIVEISLVTTVPPYMIDTLPDQDVGNISVFRASEEACGVNLEITSLNFFTYAEELNLLIAAQDLPDIINGLTAAYSSGAMGALKENMCVDIMEYAEEYAPDFLKYYQENEVFRKACTDDQGRVAAVHTAQEENYNISGLLLRATGLSGGAGAGGSDHL